jgi:excisionase family DNA binding protein
MATPNATPIRPAALRTKGAAAYLHVSEGTVRNLDRIGALRSIKLRRARLFPIEALDALLAGKG